MESTVGNSFLIPLKAATDSGPNAAPATVEVATLAASTSPVVANWSNIVSKPIVTPDIVAKPLYVAVAALPHGDI